MSAPKRIQRKRTKGWRMPTDAVYVGRPSLWSNPFEVGVTQIRCPAIDGSPWEYTAPLHKPTGERTRFHHDDGSITWHQIELATVEQVVTIYREHLAQPYARRQADAIRANLAGKDLACWCPLEDANGNRVPCHADVLLEIANGSAS